MSIPRGLRCALRPSLAMAVCLVLAGLADEWAMRAYQPGAGTRTGDTVAWVVGFDEPVVERTSRSTDPHSMGFFRSQIAVVQPCFGPRAGQPLAARVLLGPNPTSNLALRRGAAVHVAVEETEGAPDVKLFKPPLRYRWALVAALVVAATLVVAAGRVGLRVLVVMGATAALLLAALVPALARGAAPLPATGLACVGMLAAVFAISGAVDRKALAAIAGCAVGLAVAAALLVVASWWLRLSGTESVTARFLEWVEQHVAARYDYQGLLAASLLVALFGLAMDTAVTVSAGVAQVHAARPGLSRAEARAAGLNISRDVVGTMVLTLVFACVGLRLPVLLVPRAVGLSPAELLNSEAGAAELLHVVVGAIALAITGPATALLASVVVGRGQERRAAAPGRLRRMGRVAYRVVGLASVGIVVVGTLVGAVAWWRLRAERRAEVGWSPPAPEVPALIDAARDGLREHRIGEAVLCLWAAREREPHEATVRAELAYVFMSQRWLAQARREIEAALAAGADDAAAHYVAGVVCAWTGRNAEAERHLRRAVELAPDHAAARAALEQLFGP